MPRKREPSDDEIAALAKKFRRLWRPDDVMRPWLRKHRQMVVDLVHDGWSWAAMAKVLSKAGIKYRNGQAADWHAEGLRREFVKAAAPRKSSRRRGVVRVLHEETTQNERFKEIDGGTAQPSVARQDVPIPADPQLPLTPDTRAYTTAPFGLAEVQQAEPEPEFKFARFIDWGERRQSVQQPQAVELKPPGSPTPAPMPDQQHSQHYLEIMEQLTGKKPPY